MLWVIILIGHTTIQVSSKLKRELDSFKEYARETYAEVIGRLVEQAREDEESRLELSEETVKDIQEAREDLRKGRVKTSRMVRKALGL